METVKLSVQKRDMGKKAKDYRDGGFVTGEYYGKGVTNISLAIPYQDFRRAYKKAGKSTILNLEIEGEKPTYALVHEVDYNPVSDQYIHVDFMHVDLDKEVETKVPFVFVGTSSAVKDLQGTFNTAMDGVEVKCLAKDLISQIEVDISPLVDFNSVIRVSDLKLPSNITIISPADLVIATVTPVREEKEEAPVVPAGEVPVAGAEAKEGEAAADAAPAEESAPAKK
jgi:large subunit ribosomal protein L25